MNLNDIKTIVRNFVVENLDSTFSAVYWQGERVDEPQKPYCMLTELADNPTRRTAEEPNGILIENGTKVEKTVQEYRQCSITIALYVDGLNDYDDKKFFAYEQANKLSNILNRRQTAFEFYYQGVSINSISGIRPLTEIVEGGYLFRYEIDLTLGYNEYDVYTVDIGKHIDAEVTNTNGTKIDFLVSQNDQI